MDAWTLEKVKGFLAEIPEEPSMEKTVRFVEENLRLRDIGFFPQEIAQVIRDQRRPSIERAIDSLQRVEADVLMGRIAEVISRARREQRWSDELEGICCAFREAGVSI